ncbi:tetratricopeptide repeat protein [Flammeovirga sp. EKP202]|uniref:tetratricopeptide repeat protein n=1 Tax=Flammeovirga sp. EKP202 TaxID=2770592 RepID=UPI00165EE252|nr:tetratricopeptide repeat protein [Flammeovirga sp. EKP202]MBD0405321.1 tetratricopeptide repeat protein [Flammeovirga sp. EKP202]
MKKFILIVFTTITSLNQIFASDSTDILREKLAKTYTTNERAELLLQLSNANLNNDLDISLDYTVEGIELLEDLPSSQLLGKLYHTKGNIYLYKGFTVEAKQAYYQAQRIFKEINDHEYEVKTLINLSSIHQREKDYDKAKEEYLNALKGASSLPSEINKKLIPHILLNQGTLYDELNDNKIAIKRFQEVINLCNNEEELLVLKGKALHNLGNQYIKVGRDDDALPVFRESLRIKKLTFDKQGEINSLLALADYQIRLNNTKESERLYLQALDVALSLKSPIDIRNVYHNLYLYYKHQNNLESALVHFEEYKKYSDVIFEKANSRRINQLEEKHLLELEQAQLIQEKEEQKYLLIFLGVVIALLIVFSGMYFRFHRLKTQNAKDNEEKALIEKELAIVEQERVREQNEKLKAEVSFKDKEITTNIMHLMQKNELINAVSEELMSIDEQLDAKSRKKIRSIVYNLQTSTQGEIWKELEVRFGQVHHNFFDELTKAYPNLTPNEKKLCAFLKLNLSTKDISNITHQSIKSIQVARYRLRKKLGLINSEIDFQSFLSRFDHTNLTVEQIKQEKQ